MVLVVPVVMFPPEKDPTAVLDPPVALISELAPIAVFDVPLTLFESAPFPMAVQFTADVLDAKAPSPKIVLLVEFPGPRPISRPFIVTFADVAYPANCTVPVNVGASESTTLPVPVDEVTPVPPLATGSVPTVPASIAKPVAFVNTIEDGVPRSSSRAVFETCFVTLL